MLIDLMTHLRTERMLSRSRRGVVLDNNDPLQLGRLKVVVATIFPDEADPALLPWVMPESESGEGGTSSASDFKVPEIGTEVNVTFPFGDVYCGFYSRYWQSAVTHQGQFNDSYPDSHGWTSPDGTSLKFNKSDGTMDFVHPSGLEFHVDPSVPEAVLSCPFPVRFQSPSGGTGITIDPVTGQISQGGSQPLRITQDLEISNNSIVENTGTKTQTITGGKQVNIAGNEKKSIGGSQSEGVINSSDKTVGGNRGLTVGGTDLEVFGNGKTDIIVAIGYLMKVLSGNIAIQTLLASLSLSGAGVADLEGVLVNLQTAGGGGEPIPKGQSLIDFLSKLTVPTGVGDSGPPNNIADAINFLSQKAFVG